MAERIPGLGIKIWVTNPRGGDSGGSIVPVTLLGDTDAARELLPVAVNSLQSMRRQNVNNLPQYSRLTSVARGGATDGTRIICATKNGQESIQIYAPPQPGAARRLLPGQLANIMPAFEAVDQTGKLIGVVLCISGTWNPPYLFVPCDLYTTKSPYGAQTTLNPFGFENWAAGPTKSPTDAGLSWSGSARPFSGDLRNIAFFASPDPTIGQLLDFAAHGEQIPQLTESASTNTNSGGWGGAAHTFDSGATKGVWAERPYTYDFELSYSGDLISGDALLISFYFNSIMEGGGEAMAWDDTDGGEAVTLLNARPAPASPEISNGQDSWTIQYNEYIVNGPAPIPGPYPWGTITKTNQNGTFWGEITSGPIDITVSNTLDPTANDGAGASISSGNWAEADAYIDGALPKLIEEQIYISGNLFSVTPLSVYDPNTFDNPQTVYPRYYDNGIFLISIQRSSPTGTLENPLTQHPAKWQYGIYQPGAKNPWVLSTEFPVVVTDTDSPIYGAHIIPGVMYKGNPVYCLGTFRLILQQSMQ